MFPIRRLALVLLSLAAAPAHAAFHFMSVVEVFPGTPAAPDAQYVVLQMYAAGQTVVGGHHVIVYGADGTELTRFTFPGAVASGANQSRILIATAAATEFFGMTADLAMQPVLRPGGGKVCFDTIDCVAWGDYGGSPSGVGTPALRGIGLCIGEALVRRRDIAGQSTTLDAADDTNDSANDFLPGPPAPRNNAGVVGTVPAASCGDGTVGGLEECDDGDDADGGACAAGCSATRQLAEGFDITQAADWRCSR